MIIEERAISTPQIYALEKTNTDNANEGEVMGPIYPHHVNFALYRYNYLSFLLNNAKDKYKTSDDPTNLDYINKLSSVIQSHIVKNPWLQWHDPSQEDQ